MVVVISTDHSINLNEKMKNIISIVQAKKYSQDDIRDAVYQSLDLIGYNPCSKIHKISIKVNLCYYWHYSTGETTDPRVVSSVIDYIREKWDANSRIYIVESDASAVRMKYAFKMLGYEELAKKKQVSLVNLTEQNSKTIYVTCGDYVFKFQLPNILSESDIFISIPKPKYHTATEMSCALKNQFGCNPQPRKIIYHSKLDEAIVALNKIFKPNLILVDGIIVRGDYPTKIGLILAGTNSLAVDFIVAKIMGFDPFKIKHIAIAIEEKLGDVEDIMLVGTEIKDLKRKFPRLSKSSKAHEYLMKLESLGYDIYLKFTRVPLY